ncbi:MAG: rhomboid family intramembrane serine protease [Bacteroidales bacterium]|nr:rhomboid family intramembrane serine protease [Bacteroidales bacterium]HNW73391.1 rhomboid family intramembrane serine protease [Bacteroidales bacterium]HPS50781.1 rhomboid family intramembrane serine protease [Bacteroidales bacterium]
MMTQQYSPAGFSLLPPVVKNLLIINGLFFLATISFQSAFGIDLENLLGLHYFQSELFLPYQYVTYMFLHANVSHIFFNMFALWMFGYLLENVWGPKRFLTYYMITGIGAALVQTFVNWLDISSIQVAAEAYQNAPSIDAFIAFVRNHYPNYYEAEGTILQFIQTWNLDKTNPAYLNQSVEYIGQLIRMQMDVPTIGASGAVYGILLAFGMMFPNMLVFIYFLFPIKAKWIVILYGVIELVSGLSSNPNDNVAHFAHLGGMIFGFFLILYWRKKAGPLL